MKAKFFTLTLFVFLLRTASSVMGVEKGDPISDDGEIKVSLFAENPLVVTPTGIAVDEKGRVFVAESHTHFRPDDYTGPKSDRILIFEDTNGDGQADRRTVFHEGFTYIMSLAFHSDGSLYVATRMDINRLSDENHDGVADRVQLVVEMETSGTYPHNGISGLCFNADESLNFGLGENLGHQYTMVGTDGVRISGGGEGGSTYHVQADGSRLRRVTTGWWNPWGMCVDSYGRVFGTDNDPGESPPCRLIQVHEGADYGYEYRYGRSGLHPLISWAGELPGNVPMVSGTGEAPCAIMEVNGTNLPEKYNGNLLLASWADHQIERYVVTQPHDVGQVAVERSVLVHGGQNFRPVGLATAPDGSIYVSDWVLSNYELHGKGRIWKISGKGARQNTTPFVSFAETGTKELVETADQHSNIAHRVLAVRELIEKRGRDAIKWVSADNPIAVQAEAISHIPLEDHPNVFDLASRSPDPLLKHATIATLSRQVDSDAFQRWSSKISVTSLLAMKRSKKRSLYGESEVLGKALRHRDSKVWEVAVKWIADDVLTQYRNALTAEFNRPSLTVNQFLMLSSAIDRLDGKKVTDQPNAKILAATATDKTNSVPLRRAALRLLGPSDKNLANPVLFHLVSHPDTMVRVEAIRLLSGRSGEAVMSALEEIAGDTNGSTTERIEAITALASVQPSQSKSTDVPINSGQADEANSNPLSPRVRGLLLKLSQSSNLPIANASLQSLAGFKATDIETQLLVSVAERNSELDEAVARATGNPLGRPGEFETDAWMELLSGEGDSEAGERLFFHPRVGTCGNCHRHSRRGAAIGPSLSLIARRLPVDQAEAKTWLLETILQPSKDMAPQYTPWLIQTVDGKMLTGLPRRKGGTREAYLGTNGKEFTVMKDNIEFHQESRTSIMPNGLLQQLTRKELRDLFAFLLESQ